MVLKTLKEYIEEGRDVSEVLQEKRWMDPPDTSIFRFMRYDEENQIAYGHLIEEDGDIRLFKPKKLKEILGYFDMETLSDETKRRHMSHIPRNPNSVAWIGD